MVSSSALLVRGAGARGGAGRGGCAFGFRAGTTIVGSAGGRTDWAYPGVLPPRGGCAGGLGIRGRSNGGEGILGVAGRLGCWNEGLGM